MKTWTNGTFDEFRRFFYSVRIWRLVITGMNWIEGMVNTTNRQTHMNKAMIYIVDDEPTHAEFTRLLVESLGLPSTVCLGAQAFFDCFADVGPSVVVSDVIMPDITGLELLSKLKEFDYMPLVVFITGFANVSLVKKAMKQGAFDFVEKPLEAEGFIKIIEEASLLATNRYLSHTHSLQLKQKLGTLTTREKQIFDLLMKGISNKKMEDKLFISKRTIESHRYNIFRKFEVTNLSELMSLFINNLELE